MDNRLHSARERVKGVLELEESRPARSIADASLQAGKVEGLRIALELIEMTEQDTCC